ncbi:MAG: corrinoid protein [Deltaproteobacteria bacterium]|nr:corrinoid protein [Deltaproteobacteria bacterium]
MTQFEVLKKSVLDGDIPGAVALTQQALADGLKPEEIIYNAFVPAMDIVGEEYANGIKFIPEMLLSAKTMKEAMAVLAPLLKEGSISYKGRVVVGTVKGDLHDIGKNLVILMLEGAGFKVFDLGVDVPAERFVSEVKEKGADLLGLSALLSTTMVEMKTVIEALKEAGLSEKVKTMIGGAPITEAYAEQIGADAYAADAAAGVKIAAGLMGS